MDDHPILTDFDSHSVRSVMLYGRPRSLRGRVANRLRRLFGREERNELYYYGDVSDGPETITVRWNASGIFTIDPDEEPTDDRSD